MQDTDFLQPRWQGGGISDTLNTLPFRSAWHVYAGLATMCDYDQWDVLFPHYAEVQDGLHQRFLYPAVQEAVLADPPRRGRLLDYGCGTGELTERLCGYFESVLALDRSPRAVETAGRRLGSRAVVVSANELAAPGPVFDVVLLSLVLTTIADPAGADEVFAFIGRSLGPDGRFVLATTHPCFTFRALSQVSYLSSGSPYRVPIGERMEVTEYHRPLAEVLNLLGRHSFRILLAREVTDNPEYYHARGEPPHRFAGVLPLFLVLTCDHLTS